MSPCCTCLFPGLDVHQMRPDTLAGLVERAGEAAVEYVDMSVPGLPGRVADRYVLRPSGRAEEKHP